MKNRFVFAGRGVVGIALAIARILLGLFGCLMVLEAVLGFVPVAIGAPWFVTLEVVAYGFVGYLMAYGAFHHFPWERDPRSGIAAT